MHGRDIRMKTNDLAEALNMKLGYRTGDNSNNQSISEMEYPDAERLYEVEKIYIVYFVIFWLWHQISVFGPRTVLQGNYLNS